jgi:hypothetical protein
MVTRARVGTSVRYVLAGDQALALWLALRDASVSQLAEVERAARDYLGDDVDAIGRDALIARLRKGDGRVAEALGERPPGLEVELTLGLERDLLVHALHALLEL